MGGGIALERAGQALGQWLGTIFEWSQEDREIAAFSLTLILSTAFFFALLALFSALFGVFAEAIAMAFTSGLLRTFAGGAHLSTGWRCGIVSAGVATLVAAGSHHAAPALATTAPGALFAATAAVALLVAATMARYAPVDVPEKPITSDLQRRRLWALSIVMPIAWGCGFVMWLHTGSPGAVFGRTTLGAIWLASTVGLLWETFSVVPPGIRFVRWLDLQIGRIAHYK